MNLESLIRAYVLDSGNPDLIAYGQRLLNSLARAIWWNEYLMRLGGMRKSRVLDIGCGFGWDSIMIALLGDNEVVANDIRPTMVNAVDSCLARLERDGIRPKVNTLLGDVCQLGVAPGSFDAVLCNQTIEHVHDLGGMFQAIARVLRPGGRGVITNDNNALHPETRRSSEAMWRLRDRSAEYIEQLKQERPIENRDSEPYHVMRRRIVQEACPGMSEADLETVATATAGMVAADIRALAAGYRPGQELPAPSQLSWCRNPVTGEYCERLLDPFEVAAKARSAGLKPRLYHHPFRRFPLSMLNVANTVDSAAIHRMFFRVRPGFILVVTRE